MVVVRDVFRLKFGKAKEATDLWKQAVVQLRRSGYGSGGVRLLTDVAGPAYYTIVLESTYDSLAQWEQTGQAVRQNAEWRSVYAQIVALTEGGHREILSVIE